MLSSTPRPDNNSIGNPDPTIPAGGRHDRHGHWVRSSPAHRCPACDDHRGRCSRLGRKVVCRTAGYSRRLGTYGRPKQESGRKPYWVFTLSTEPTPVATPRPGPERHDDIGPIAAGYEAWLTPELGTELLDHLRLPKSQFAAEALAAIGVGWRARTHRKGRKPLGAGWTFRERDGAWRTIGVQVRSRDGDKRQVHPSHRGLTIPAGWRERAIEAGVLFLPEGATCTLAGTIAGLACVGRPSNVGGVEHLVELLKDLPRSVRIVVVGERDYKQPVDHWPGRVGAYATASKLAARLGRPVEWAVVPEGHKDLRDTLIARADGSGARRTWERLGRQLAEEILAATQVADPTPARGIMTRPETRCPHCPPTRLAGKPETNTESKRCVIDPRCRQWSCEACHPWQGNRWRDWLPRCFYQWADPARLPDDSGDGPAPVGPDTTRCGPWNLFAVEVPDDAAYHRLKSRLSRLNTKHRQPMYDFVGAIQPVPDGVLRVQDSILGGGNTKKSLGHATPRFVVVALHPIINPDRDFRLKPEEALRPTTADAATGGFGHALDHVPTTPPEGCGHYEPVTASDGWQIPPKIRHPGNWRREGRSAVSAKTAGEIADRIGIADPDHAVGGPDVQDSAVWHGSEAETLIYGLLLDPSRCPPRPRPADVERLVDYHRWWVRAVGATRIGPAVQAVLEQRLKRLPTERDRADLEAAAEQDERMRACHAEAEEIERDLRKSYPDPATRPEFVRMCLGDPDPEVVRTRARARQEQLRRCKRFECECCDGAVIVTVGDPPRVALRRNETLTRCITCGQRAIETGPPRSYRHGETRAVDPRVMKTIGR